MSEEFGRTLFLMVQIAIQLFTVFSLAGLALMAFRRARAAGLLVGAASTLLLLRTGLNLVSSVGWLYGLDYMLDHGYLDSFQVLSMSGALVSTLCTFLIWGCLFAAALVGRSPSQG